MKKILKVYFLVQILISVFSCVPRNVSQMGGYGNYGYLLFVSNGKTSAKKPIEVTIDKEPAFVAKVIKASESSRKGKARIVGTGQHRVVVKQNGQILVIKDFIISAQETQLIQLP